MYPDILPDEKKLCWSYEDVFADKRRLVKAYTHENFRMNMHYHDFYELNIVLCGQGMHYFGSSRCFFTKGDMFVIPPGSRHGYYTDGRADIFHILLHESFFLRYRQELSVLPGYTILFTLEPAVRSIDGGRRYMLHIGERLEELMPELMRMHSLYYCHEDEDDIALNALALYVISWLCGLCRQSGIAKTAGELKTLSACIRAVNAGNISEVSPDSVAMEAAVSKSTLFRTFKKGLGMTPGEYIKLCRLDSAALQLRSGRDSISDIAQNCGFFDSSHFIHSFSKRFGMTPSQYRREAYGIENN